MQLSSSNASRSAGAPGRNDRRLIAPRGALRGYGPGVPIGAAAVPLGVAAVYALLWVVSGALEGRPEVDPDVVRLRKALLLPNTRPFALYVTQYFSGIAAVVLAATFASRARSHDAREHGRGLVLAAALGGVASGVAILVALAFSALFTIIAGGDAGGLGSALSPLDLLAGNGRTMFITLPYLAATGCLVAAGVSVRAAVAGGLLLYFGEPIVSSLFANGGGWMGEVPRFLLNDNVQTIMRQNGAVEAFRIGADRAGIVEAVDRPSIGHAVLVLSIYAAVFGAVGALLHTRANTLRVLR